MKPSHLLTAVPFVYLAVWSIGTPYPGKFCYDCDYSEDLS